MGTHRFLGPVGILPGDRVDHRQVLVLRHRVQASVVVEPEGVLVAPQSGQHVADHLVAGEVGDHGVEGRVVGHVQPVRCSRDLGAGSTGPGDAAQLLDLVRLRVGSGPGGQCGLDEQPELDELAHLLDPHEGRHRVAAPRLLHDQTVGLDARQRLAHGCRRHAEGAGELFDVEAGARFERVGHEHVGDDLVHRTGQRLALGQALSGGGLVDCFDLMTVHLGLRVRAGEAQVTSIPIFHIL